MTKPIEKRPFRLWTRDDLLRHPRLAGLPQDVRRDMLAVSAVLPFRVNDYVADELVDWDDLPGDPLFQLTFPQPGMLEPDDLARMRELVGGGADADVVKAAAREIQLRLNPHPAGQVELNVPRGLDGQPLPGLQHKYRETVLFFPSPGQTCHAYCTYCFRWAQFVGLDDLKFAEAEAGALVDYVAAHPEVQSVLITGGDPLVMRTKVLRRYVEPLLDARLEHVTSIRIGTKAPAYWPHRFVTDDDADDLLRLFEEVDRAGRHLALMAHYSHPRELQTRVAREALRRIRGTGAVVRCQAPLIQHVNDKAQVWADLWRTQVKLGAVPYYMFVERDTGARHYFAVPLARAVEIFRKAYRRVTGLGRTVRGPVMSATPGKVQVLGTAELADEKVFLLQFLQARQPEWVGRPFAARFDPAATWLDHLRPVSEEAFFFQPDLEAMLQRAGEELAPDPLPHPDGTVPGGWREPPPQG